MGNLGAQPRQICTEQRPQNSFQVRTFSFCSSFSECILEPKTLTIISLKKHLKTSIPSYTKYRLSALQVILYHEVTKLAWAELHAEGGQNVYVKEDSISTDSGQHNSARKCCSSLHMGPNYILCSPAFKIRY